MTVRQTRPQRQASTATAVPEAAQAVNPPTVPEKKPHLPLLGKLAILSMLIPAFFNVGTLSLSPSKTLFLFVTPFLLINLFRGGYGRLVWADFLVLAFAGWMTLSMFINHTSRIAIEYTGSNTVALLGGYLTARASIRSKANFIGLIRFLVVAVLISLPFAIIEVNNSRAVVPAWLEKIPGIQSNNDASHEPRFGLWRSQWVFAHPIHYGIFCTLALSLVFVGMVDTLSTFRRWVTTAIIGVCCFLSVSSGPFLALVFQFALILWAFGMRWTGMRWRVLATLLAIGYTILELASNRAAIYVIVSQLAFSGSTAFSRRVLFERGVLQVNREPLFGIGFNNFDLPAWMTGSIDNFWLFLALTFGFPAFLFLFLAFIFAMIQVGRRNLSARPDLIPLRLAWVFTMVSLVLVLATVSIWGEIYSMVLFILGSGMWFAAASLTAPAARAAQPSGSATDDPVRLRRKLAAQGSNAVVPLDLPRGRKP